MTFTTLFQIPYWSERDHTTTPGYLFHTWKIKHVCDW